MRHNWTITACDAHLYFKINATEWIIVGWVDHYIKRGIPGWRVFCRWIPGESSHYPEGRVFDTLKQAKRALKLAATVAYVGGQMEDLKAHTLTDDEMKIVVLKAKIKLAKETS